MRNKRNPISYNAAERKLEQNGTTSGTTEEVLEELEEAQNDGHTIMYNRKDQLIEVVDGQRRRQAYSLNVDQTGGIQ